MKRTSLFSLPLLALVAASVTVPVAVAKPVALPDRFELGRNGEKELCSAARNWADPGTSGYPAISYSFTCRGSSANRFLGLVRNIAPSDVAALDATLDCGEATAVTIPVVGEARSRRCFDKVLGLETVETRVVRKGEIYSASAAIFAQGPAEEGLRIMLGLASVEQDRGRISAAAVDPGLLPPAPQGVAGNAAAVANADDALKNGLRLVRQGLHLDAARVANDALSRLPTDAAPGTRIELLLLAGLADSNLTYFDSADDYFRRADTLLAANASLPGADILARKRRNYAALHLLNKHDYVAVSTSLEQTDLATFDPDQPLLDAPTVRTLNQARAGARSASELVLSGNDRILNTLMIDAQGAWARSVALLAQNRPDDAGVALAAADRAFDTLSREAINQQRVLWLGSRIERQRARLLLRGDNRAGALAALDKAIVDLRFAESDGDRGPALAETQLERAAVLAGGNADRETVFVQFDDAISSLIESQANVGGLPPQTRSYLDALVAAAAGTSGGIAQERFFRALQAAANPAVARQFVKLQSLVTADPSLGPKVQDRQDIEAEINRLRFEIASAATTDAEKVARLEATKTQLENRSLALKAELSGNQSYVQVNDNPATVAEIQQILLPGEGYFKLSKVGGYVFAALIDREGATVYRVARSAGEIDGLVKAVRGSITGGGGKLPIFSVGGANALYKLLAGPAAARLKGYDSLVVDASGVLDALPAGVLVTDDASVAAFTRSRKIDLYDYTKVSFLARQSAVSAALSPRSLIVSRGLPASRAPLPFIGFAQHAPVTLTAQAGGQMISIGTNCEVEREKVAELGRELRPVNASELKQATDALGLAQTTEMIGAAFTDTALRARTDLDQFQVLHFATHGLTEGQWACAKAPPALVTTLGEGGSDGILSFDEVARMRLDANLVVLSACDTAAGVSAGGARAAGQEEGGASLDGLVRAFLAARAHAVLSTYWPVSDAGETEALITDFYRNARTDTIGNALRKAEAGLIANPTTSHPKFWAPFLLVGDAQKPLLTGAAKVALDQGAGSSTNPVG